MSDEAISGVGSGGPVPFKVDKDGSLHNWPYTKMAYGESNVQTHITEANGLPVKVTQLNATAVVSGVVTVATGSEAALSVSVVARRFRIRALPTNDPTARVDIGTTGLTLNNGLGLRPGDWIEDLQVANLNVIHAIASVAAQKLEYFGEV